MKIQGIIEAKKLGKSGEGEFGAWQVYEFTIDGKRYSTFKQSVYDMFHVGQSVEIDGEVTEKGFNMKTMKLVEGDVAAVEKVPQNAPNKRNPYDKDPVGLAVDIFCALCNRAEKQGNTDDEMGTQIMNHAITLVKQAREAFE